MRFLNIIKYILNLIFCTYLIYTSYFELNEVDEQSRLIRKLLTTYLNKTKAFLEFINYLYLNDVNLVYLMDYFFIIGGAFMILKQINNAIFFLNISFIIKIIFINNPIIYFYDYNNILKCNYYLAIYIIILGINKL